MFFEYKSSSLFELAKVFAKKTNSVRLGDPFSKIWVVVQNKEAQQWLTLQVAKIEDIAFNFEFILPSELIWKLYRMSHSDLPTSLPSDRIAMQWQVFEILKSKKEIFGLNALPEHDKSLFQFSGQIADVMDLYQVFRPELLESWEKGKLTTIDATEKWQLKIWNELNLIWKEKHPSIPSRNKAFNELKKLIVSENNSLVKYPESIFIFGLSQVSSAFLDLITSSSNKVDIHFFDVNLKWETKGFDLMFTDWAKPKEDSEQLLKSFIEKKNIKHNLEHVSSLQSDTVLEKISRTSSVIDQIIELHSCHNPKREVEVLKDYLLKSFDENKDLNPEEVLVLVPEMEEYSPIIESVFKGDENKLRIPIYSPSKISSQSHMAFTSFLELISSNFKITDVLDFLENESIRIRFNFSENDIYTLKKWLLKNRIHWGLELSDSIYSIEKAVSNFMTGYAMEIEDFCSFDGLIPFEGIQSSDHAELVAKFSAVLQMFKPIKSAIHKNKSFKEWLFEIKLWALKLFQNDEKAVISFNSSLDKLIEYAHIVESEVEVNYNLFKEWFIEQLSDQKASSSGIGNGVVLSSYIPYRSIPFKKVCILGLNEKVFPRNAIRPGFDLINSYPKPGDRIMKEDDKLLFYELLVSTSQSLFFSFLGRDQHSDSEKLPSMIIQKMMDELEGFKPILHKLHGFDWMYFKEAHSYSNSTKELGVKVYSNNEKEQSFITKNEFLKVERFIDQIEINELTKFFVHPCKYMINNGLSIRTSFEEPEPNDREVFKVSALEKYNLDQLLLDGIDSEITIDHLKEYSIRAGFSPQGIPGDHSFETEYNDVNELLSLAKPYLIHKETKGDLDFTLNDHRIVGSYNKVYSDTNVFIKAAKFKAKDFINTWIKHLILASSPIKLKKTVLIGRDSNNKNQTYIISNVEKPDDLIHELIKWFKEAKTEKSFLAFFPEATKAFIEAKRANKDNPYKKAKSKWIGSEFIKGEKDDYYNSLYWRGENPLELSSFQNNAINFWEPLLTHLKNYENE